MHRYGEDREQLQAYLLSHIDDAVVAIDLQGEVIYWNHRAEHVFQVPFDKAIGRTLNDIGIHDWLNVPDVRRTLVSTGRWRGEQQLRLPNGETRCIELSVTRLADDVRDPTGCLTLCRDVTAQKGTGADHTRLFAEERQKRLTAERALEEAEEALQRRDQSFSIAAHEQKNLLTKLLGYTQLLERYLVEGQTIGKREQSSVRMIAEQVQQLNQQLTRELDLSRLQTDQFQLLRTPMDLAALTRRVVKELQSTNTTHSFVLRASAESLLVDGDVVRLEQVLQNLVQNAQKYSSPGSVITFRVERRNDHGRVSITDQGIGIPAAAQANLFQLFYRANNVDAVQADGIGIGLYVVKHIVTLHGGTIEVESTEDSGSTFTMIVPLIKRVDGTIREHSR